MKASKIVSWSGAGLTTVACILCALTAFQNADYSVAAASVAADFLKLKAMVFFALSIVFLFLVVIFFLLSKPEK